MAVRPRPVVSAFLAVALAAVALTAAPVATSAAPAGPLARLAFVGAPTQTGADDYTTFAVTGFDSDEIPLGDQTTQAVFSTDSTNPAAIPDEAGNTLRMMEARVTEVTATVGDVSISTTVTVVPGPVAGAGEQHSIDTQADRIVGSTIAFHFDAFDDHFNHIGDVTPTASFASDVAADRVTGNRVRLMSSGIHKITGTGSGVYAALDYDWYFNVVKDTSTPKSSLGGVVKAKTTKVVTITLKTGAGTLRPTGTVRLYYGKKFVTTKYGSTSKATLKVTLPALKKGKYAVHLSYSGSATYTKVITATKTLHVK